MACRATALAITLLTALISTSAGNNGPSGSCSLGEHLASAGLDVINMFLVIRLAFTANTQGQYPRPIPKADAGEDIAVITLGDLNGFTFVAHRIKRAASGYQRSSRGPVNYISRGTFNLRGGV
jgi:hypothetical protein